MINVIFKNAIQSCVLFSLLFIILISDVVASNRNKEVYDCNALENRDTRTTIDLKLAKRWKKKKKEIKQHIIEADRSLKVRLSFFPFLDPPMNLAIGKCVSAEEGRLAIEKGLEYNKGISFVVMQELLPHHWARIGLTDLAELAWISISPEELARLADPNLSTEQFQKVYRALATLKERKLPFGLGTQKIEVVPED